MVIKMRRKVPIGFGNPAVTGDFNRSWGEEGQKPAYRGKEVRTTKTLSEAALRGFGKDEDRGQKEREPTGWRRGLVSLFLFAWFCWRLE